MASIRDHQIARIEGWSWDGRLGPSAQVVGPQSCKGWIPGLECNDEDAERKTDKIWTGERRVKRSERLSPISAVKGDLFF